MNISSYTSINHRSKRAQYRFTPIFLYCQCRTRRTFYKLYDTWIALWNLMPKKGRGERERECVCDGLATPGEPAIEVGSVLLSTVINLSAWKMCFSSKLSLLAQGMSVNKPFGYHLSNSSLSGSWDEAALVTAQDTLTYWCFLCSRLDQTLQEKRVVERTQGADNGMMLSQNLLPSNPV